jgi:hypothetical protein
LIDFDISQDKDLAEKSYNRYQDLYLYKGKTKQVYERYAKARDELKKKYGDDVYSPISQICKDHREYVEENQGSLNEKELWEHRARPIPLADGVTLNFLYNYHNDHREEKTKITSADINNLSVCFTIDYEKANGEVERFLFTGDLEEFDSQKKVEDATRGMQRINGESDLVKYNPWLKEGVMLYKAAHHGSKTSSSDNLMEAINPKHIVIPATAGNKEKSDGEKEAAQESEGSTGSSSTTQNTGNKTGKKFGFPNQEALDKITRQLMGWGVPDAEEIEAKFKFRWDEKEQSIHKVWLELSKQVLQEEAAQYLKFGSELLSAVAYDFNLQYKLQTFGIPYIVLCEVPLSRISEWFLQSIPDAIIAGDGGFPIDRIYPDEIISFEKHNEFTKSLVC